MIVEPDFFGHWKTRMLVGLTQSKPSEICPIKLWAFCHQRRAWIFDNMTPAKLAAICEWEGNVDLFWEAMQDSGFIRFYESQLIVHDWDVTNASLVKNWKNGAKGGRPKKTQPEPKENPKKTQPEPKAIPATTDKKGREEKGIKKVQKKATAPHILAFDEFISTDRFSSLNTEAFRESYLAFAEYRIKAKKKITRRAVELHLIDALKVGPQIAGAMMADSEKNGWTGFYFEERVEEYRQKVATKPAAPVNRFIGT